MKYKTNGNEEMGEIKTSYAFIIHHDWDVSCLWASFSCHFGAPSIMFPSREHIREKVTVAKVCIKNVVKKNGRNLDWNQNDKTWTQTLFYLLYCESLNMSTETFT